MFRLGRYSVISVETQIIQMYLDKYKDNRIPSLFAVIIIDRWYSSRLKQCAIFVYSMFIKLFKFYQDNKYVNGLNGSVNVKGVRQQ